MKNTLVAVSVIAVLCSGCASIQPKMDINDLYHFQLDCANKEAQIKFLRTQIPTKREKMAAGMSLGLLDEIEASMKGTKTQNRLIKEGYYDRAAKDKIWKLESDCPNKTIYDYEDEKYKEHFLDGSAK